VQQALRRRDGLIVVTGDAGTGKTLLCRTLLHEMGDAAFVSVVLDPRLTEDDLIAHVLTDFGVTRADLPIPAQVRRRALTAALQGFLRELIPIKGYAVIIIDEAQHLSPGVFELLRLLMNFETDEAKLLQVVLVGSRDLDQRLREPEMHALAQRVARRSEMEPLSGFEVKRYIERRLSTAQHFEGSWHGTFTPAAARAVSSVSKGVPRVVNQVCDLALEIGQEHQTRVVDARIVRAAARRLHMEGTSRSWPWRMTAAATAVFTLVGAGAMAWTSRSQSAPAAVARMATTRTAGVSLASASTFPADAAVGTLASASGITVTVGSFKSPDRAAAVAAQIQGLALPAFTRVRDGQWHQVVVGPYLTTEEATAAQRGLTAHGFSDTRTLIEPPQSQGVGQPGAEDRRAMLLASADRMSLVLQLAEEPKKVVTRQVDGSTLEIDLGPIVSEQRAARLTASAGVPVVASVDLQSITSDQRDPLMRARVVLRGANPSDVRVVGRRVYVDFAPLARAEAPALPRERNEVPALSPEPNEVARGLQPSRQQEPPAAVANPPRVDYDAAIKPVLSQLTDAERFLLSATAAPAPEVLAALERMMSDLHTSARAIDAPPAAKESHVLLLAAISQARRAVEPDFSGDRVMQARQAIALWTEAAQRKES
jgi:general secretion pathway protein A